jgi:hypothetical protein
VVKRTSPRDGWRSIQKHPFGCSSLRSEQVARTKGHCLVDDLIRPILSCGSGCERTLCPSRQSALDHLRTAEVGTSDQRNHVRGRDGHCFIFPVASDVPRSLSPDRRNHRRQEPAIVDYPSEPGQRIPVGSRVSPRPPVVASNGWAPEADGKAQGRWRLAKIAPAQDSVIPFAADPRSIPRAAPPPVSGAARCPLG